VSKGRFNIAFLSSVKAVAAKGFHENLGFLSRSVGGAGYGGVVLHKSPIESCEPKESAKSGEGCWCRPISNG